jgi:regulator of sigma E protease
MHDILTNAVGFVLVLGFLIFAHESGHFIAAKLFGVRVLVFSFGFGKRLFGFRHGGTDYRLSLIPLGGYVRMAGDMADDRITVGPQGAGSIAPAQDDSFQLPTGAPDEFLSKPKWQRFLILLAGPLMNLIIAVAFLAILSMVGTETLIIEPVIGAVDAQSAAARAGLAVGDRIVSVNGDAVDEFDDLRLTISMHAGTPLRVEYLRNGVRHSTTLTPLKAETDYGPIGRAGIRPMIQPVVGRIEPKSVALQSGLRSGDRIVAANGVPVRQFDDFSTAVEKAKGAAIPLDVIRAGQPLHVTLGAVKMLDPKDPFRGFYPPTKFTKLSLVPALKDSLERNRTAIKYAAITIGRLFRAEGSVKEFSGPLSIARISGEMLRRGWFEVVSLMAMISLQLGFMNLLPIPVLDGGHIMVLLVEGIARRDLSFRVKERIQQVGFAALAALMLVVMYNDVIQNVLRMRRG